MALGVMATIPAPHTLNVSRAELLAPIRPFGGPSGALRAVMLVLRQRTTPELLTRLIRVLEKGTKPVRIVVECDGEQGIDGISERIVIQ